MTSSAVVQLFSRLRSGDGVALVVGLGITGVETALFLHRCGVAVRVVERTPRAEFERKSKLVARVAELTAAGIECHFGIDGEAVQPFCAASKNGAAVTLAILSPGVSLESAVVATLRRLAITLVSELELGIEVAAVPAIVVTGSNGKSTTVSLIHHILVAAGLRAHLVGNVGTPVVATLSPQEIAAGRAAIDWLVVEASSYQLESCEVLRPKIGVFLNLSDNHLERHGSMARYLEAKARMLAHQQSSDFAVLNGDDRWIKQIEARQNGTVVRFGRELKTDGARAGIEYHPSAGKDEILVTLPGGGAAERYALAQSKLLGLHNRYDAAAAILSARLAGVSQSDAQAALLSFTPLEHRIEPCGEKRGALFVNDSKSTTVAAAVAGVTAIREAYPDRQLTLLIGGAAKAGSWEPLLSLCRSLVADKVLPRIICFGGDGRLLESHCAQAQLPAVRVKTMADAVTAAYQGAGSGDIVLLSPGCASFDEFTDFEHRGAVFKKLVAELPA